ncbi:MAG TPA: SDR family oxidoreductase [Metalysinibacillus sp.]
MKKFALVVGATGAIGRAICEELARDGWSLYVHYNSNKDKGLALVGQLQAEYPTNEFILVQANFLEAEGAQVLAKQLFTVQAIVFASGQAHYALLEDTQVADMEALWHVHVQNPMRLVALTAAKLRQHHVSYVIFIGSIWGDIGAAGETVYSAVKGAQHSFVRAYAQEVALSHTRVNVIAPGMVDTPMNGHLAQEEKQEIINTIPLGYMASCADIGAMVRFYVSGQADYVTGQIIRVNGGWHI